MSQRAGPPFFLVPGQLQDHGHGRLLKPRKLLQAPGRAARRAKQNRSALIRDALRAHLPNLELRMLAQRDRQGYSARPQTAHESGLWETEATWPEE
jgi:hypothetical protein